MRARRRREAPHTHRELIRVRIIRIIVIRIVIGIIRIIIRKAHASSDSILVTRQTSKSISLSEFYLSMYVLYNYLKKLNLSIFNRSLSPSLFYPPVLSMPFFFLSSWAPGLGSSPTTIYYRVCRSYHVGTAARHFYREKIDRRRSRSMKKKKEGGC